MFRWRKYNPTFRTKVTERQRLASGAPTEGTSTPAMTADEAVGKITAAVATVFRSLRAGRLRPSQDVLDGLKDAAAALLGLADPVEARPPLDDGAPVSSSPTCEPAPARPEEPAPANVVPFTPGARGWNPQSGRPVW